MIGSDRFQHQVIAFSAHCTFSLLLPPFESLGSNSSLWHFRNSAQLSPCLVGFVSYKHLHFPGGCVYSCCTLGAVSSRANYLFSCMMRGMFTAPHGHKEGWGTVQEMCLLCISTSNPCSNMQVKLNSVLPPCRQRLPPLSYMGVE